MVMAGMRSRIRPWRLVALCLCAWILAGFAGEDWPAEVTDLNDNTPPRQEVAR